MKKRSLFALLSAAALLAGCSPKPLVQSQELRADISTHLSERSAWLPELPAALNTNERQALEYLYAYMPVGDVGDYPVELYLKNVRASFDALGAMPWGKSLPNDLFLHYVLPVRVNNENLDTSRIDFYAELKDRVKGLSMADAILEVNHWCHEKVIYAPSDGRTSAPSASVRSAYGRCGEESTFTVAALRSVGIPARQVYTPRWAHTDDNHAWVEAWADGTWYYLGACEPEPVLDMGWFDAPAKRAMLMHTKVFGNYNGPEEVINRTDCYTEINVTEKYAPVAKVEVLVTDTAGRPVPGAWVDFGIYNYAEFYPAAHLRADSAGKTSLSAGLGDMMIWATDNVRYGYQKVSFGKQPQVTIVLSHGALAAPYRVDLDVVPPVEAPAAQRVTPEQRAENNRRLAVEDSIRNAYMATWMSAADARALAEKIGADTSVVIGRIKASRGNWREIASFLEQSAAKGPQVLATAFDLLDVVSAKDLRDTPADVLMDHLQGALSFAGTPYFKEYILNPRVGTELLVPYRAVFHSMPSDIKELIALAGKVAVVDSLNPARIPISPIGVHHLQMGDRAARERYFIATARTQGFAARYEPITNRLQYYDQPQGRWINVVLGTDLDNLVQVPEKGMLKIEYKPTKRNADPKYEIHFSVAKIENGRPRAISLDRADVDMGGSGSLAAIFKTPLPVEAGDYMLVSGTRMANGTVLSQIQFFSVVAGKQTDLTLTMREDESGVQVIGSMNPETLFIPQGAAAPTSVLATTGRGYFVLALLEANKEPTNHALRDIAAVAGEFEQWGRGLVLLYRTPDELAKLRPAEYGKLPGTITWGVDADGQTERMLKQSLKISGNPNLPLFVIADTFGRVVFASQGYQIGLGEQMIKVIRQL